MNEYSSHFIPYHSLRLASPPIGNDHQGTASMIGLSVIHRQGIDSILFLCPYLAPLRVHHVHIKKKKIFFFLGRWVVCTARQHVHIMCLDAWTYRSMINLSVLVG